MDFWNRLIGGSGSSSVASKQPLPTTPQQRLAKFKKVWQSLMHTWRNSRENDPNSQEQLRSYVKRLTDLLIEEEKRSARLCMNFCYENQVFIFLSQIGQSGTAPVIRECITAFATLIDNEEEDFLAQESFAQSLIAFLRRTSQHSETIFEGEFVELLFSISAKIRLSPGILQAWFITRGDEEGGREFETLGPQQKFAGITNKDDFPLFYLLIDYVHHEGRVGDFARTGLLYIIEAASTSGDLEKWIVESDLATLMASGLGALYSQLSRKLVVTYPTDDPPTILVLSDYSSAPPTFGAESSNSPEFQTHLETFLSYLIFWQDVLEHCRSADVKQTLLDHFQVLFLQQLLYPSLLESSDIDGGSSVAVLTYVRVVLDTLEHPDLIHLILSYLMALPDKPKSETESIQSPSMERRRRSLDLLSKVAAMDDTPTPDLFNLVDLVLTSLKSKSQQTVSATLRLVSTILRKHHPYSVSTLLKVIPYPEGAHMRTIGAHNREMELLFTLVGDISEDRDVSESYSQHLKDNLVLLESHPCSAKHLNLKNGPSRGVQDDANPRWAKLNEMYTHTIHPNDPLLKNVIELLNTFFANTVETNLILTAVIVDLATCSWMRPEGWLLFDPTSYEFDNSDESDGEEAWDELDDVENELAEIMGENTTTNPDISLRKERKRIIELKKANRTPRFTSTPPILAALQGLVCQIRTYRREIPDLNDKLAERKRAFQFTDELNEALLSSPLVSPPMSSPVRNSKLEAITPRNLVRPSSSNTGRQRKYSGGSQPMQASRSSRGLAITPSQVRALSPAAAVITGGSPSSPFNSHVTDTTMRRIKVLQPGQAGLHLPPPPEGESREGSVWSDAGTAPFEEGTADFTLSHLLTNIMILQEFVLELAALVQVRASLFGDLKFA
ncbi:uncharacterized protein LAJ45_02682 [Morchella importuna]|uniref:uncharacterized protein n=1 Tax=Morchella importuna TaxID=1174673 RepID=UPI001E8E921E|nr:uncharacterized protein LAJ45_02682 [Morchella importuna]KAH8153095.1 hypothetical protein LAJ45_02682 [Morchella importuna]